MPRVSNRVFKKRKHQCNANAKRLKPSEVEVQPRPSTSENTDEQNLLNISGSPTTSRPISSSKKKVGPSLASYDLFITDKDQCNDVINLGMLELLLGKIAVCVKCGGSLKIKTNFSLGLSVTIQLFCVSCGYEVSEKNDNKLPCGKSEINSRLVYAFRCIGKGEESAKQFCAVMNLRNPPAFKYYNKLLCNVAKEVCINTMREAVEESVEENDGVRDICAAFDGTWQRRGHRSLNGAVSAISVTTGKVLDVRVYSKHCRCKNRLQRLHENSCVANYDGSSGGMEVKGVIDMFKSSESQYNIRYRYYLGDGDSSAFPSVQKETPYGPGFEIEKLECVGHVQKRMGTRLRSYKSKKGQAKLSDGKSAGGRGRLTEDAIKNIQTYYGLAIRRNVSSLENMKQAVWAEYFHLLSSNDDPSHGLCPKGEISWCKYNKAIANDESYDHDKHLHLPQAIMEDIKPIFRDLAAPDLLKRCLHGGTQNPNESLNSVIWSRVPKSTFVMKTTLELGVYEAIATFNKGYIVRCLILEKLGVSPGNNLVRMMKQLDEVRIYKAEKAIDELEKKFRKKSSLAKARLEDVYQQQEDPENPSYGAGMH